MTSGQMTSGQMTSGQMSDGVMIQVAIGDYAQFTDLTERRHSDYCRQYRLDYRLVSETTAPGLHPIREKNIAIRKAIEDGYRSVFCLDADAVIWDTGEDLRAALTDESAILGMCDHISPWDPYHLSCGVLYVRGCLGANELFEEAWADELPGDRWIEQSALNRVLERRGWRGVQVLHARWASCDAVNYVPNPVVRVWGIGFLDYRLRLMAGAVSTFPK